MARSGGPFLPCIRATRNQIETFDERSFRGPSDEGWPVAAYVRNIENDQNQAGSGLHPMANILTAGFTPPRTYGLRTSVRF